MQHALLRRCLVRKPIVVAVAALCILGTSSLALADNAVKGELAPIRDEMKAGKDMMKAQDNAMESGTRSKKRGQHGPIMQYREKMKAQRHEMMERMKAYKEAAMLNPPAPATAP
jgi:hypothetical protein